MYKNNFVVTLADNSNQIIRESIQNSVTTVYIPFYTEYKIKIKNCHADRIAKATVKIDGTDVFNRRCLIITPNSEVLLERFLLNNDLNSGKKFLFVPVDDSRVSDPTNSENGIIEVQLTLEQPKFHITVGTQPIKWEFQEFPDYYNTLCSTKVYNTSYNYTVSNYDQDLVKRTLNATLCNSGATVEGDNSGQQFEYTQINCAWSSDITTFRIKLLALTQAMQKVIRTPNSKRIYCINCGKSNKRNYTYCSKCGTKLMKDSV